MKKSSNVQKSNELKEAEMSAKENSSNAMTRKITFIGDNAISLYTNRRYLSLSLLVKLMSDSLDEDLPFEVNLTCLTLEAFAKAFKELGDYEFSLLIFKNLEPLNFFKLLNDISTQTYYNSSKEVSNKFLTSEKVIKKLNRFYNEYYEIYDYCLKNNYTSLYLFEITAMNNNETLKNNIHNLLNTLNPIEKYIIESRYGLNGQEPKTFTEIGKDLHKSREFIRRSEAKAIRKLRSPVRANMLKGFDYVK